MKDFKKALEILVSIQKNNTKNNKNNDEKSLKLSPISIKSSIIYVEAEIDFLEGIVNKTKSENKGIKNDIFDVVFGKCDDDDDKSNLDFSKRKFFIDKDVSESD